MEYQSSRTEKYVIIANEISSANNNISIYSLDCLFMFDNEISNATKISLVICPYIEAWKYFCGVNAVASLATDHSKNFNGYPYEAWIPSLERKVDPGVTNTGLTVTAKHVVFADMDEHSSGSKESYKLIKKITYSLVGSYLGGAINQARYSYKICSVVKQLPAQDAPKEDWEIALCHETEGLLTVGMIGMMEMTKKNLTKCAQDFEDNFEFTLKPHRNDDGKYPYNYTPSMFAGCDDDTFRSILCGCFKSTDKNGHYCKHKTVAQIAPCRTPESSPCASVSTLSSQTNLNSIANNNNNSNTNNNSPSPQLASKSKSKPSSSTKSKSKASKSRHPTTPKSTKTIQNTPAPNTTPLSKEEERVKQILLFQGMVQYMFSIDPQSNIVEITSPMMDGIDIGNRFKAHQVLNIIAKSSVNKLKTVALEKFDNKLKPNIHLLPIKEFINKAVKDSDEFSNDKAYIVHILKEVTPSIDHDLAVMRKRKQKGTPSSLQPQSGVFANRRQSYSQKEEKVSKV